HNCSLLRNHARWSPCSSFYLPVRDDLEGLWAAAQIDAFGRLQNEVSEFGFYSFAIQATARKYLVPVRPGVGFIRGQMAFPNQRHSVLNNELYETTTGATAVAESLQLQRTPIIAAALLA